MNKIIYFDICALALMIGILIIFYMRKNTPCIKNSVYKKILWVVLVSTILNIIGTLIENKGIFIEPLNYSLKVLYYFAHTSIPLLFCIYCIVYINENKRFEQYQKWLLIFPQILLYLLTVTTPFTHLLFSYAKTGEYVKGPAFYFSYIVTAFYIVSSFAYIIYHRTKYKKFIRVTLYTLWSFSILPIAMQNMMPVYLLENFASTVCALLLFMTLESMDLLLDYNTNMFTQTALIEALGIYYSKDIKFDAVIIKNAELELIIDRMGLALVNNLFRDVADYLTENVRPAKAYFINNECFVIIYRSGNYDIEKTIFKIQERMKEPWYIGDLEIRISEYICRINVPRDADSKEKFLEYINYIQNIKKDQNKRLFVDDINIESRKRRIKIERAIKYALENNTFQVFFQPIYSLDSKRIMSAEALVRLNDPELGNISPCEFIGMAEENGKIVKVGQMVFEQVCRFISENDIRKLGIEYIEINLSVIQCMQADLVKEFKRIMEKYNVDPEMICLEITETAAENAPEMLEDSIEQFKEMGIIFALDDFGTGYSNLQKMIKLPFTYVKYDKEMIWSALSNPRAKIAVESNVMLMKRLGMRVIAEGVENLEQLKELSKMEFDFIQGYYFSKAIPGEEFIEYITNFMSRVQSNFMQPDLIQDDFL